MLEIKVIDKIDKQINQRSKIENVENVNGSIREGDISNQ